MDGRAASMLISTFVVQFPRAEFSEITHLGFTAELKLGPVGHLSIWQTKTRAKLRKSSADSTGPKSRKMFPKSSNFAQKDGPVPHPSRKLDCEIFNTDQPHPESELQIRG